jgi:hypothetical protein
MEQIAAQHVPGSPATKATTTRQNSGPEESPGVPQICTSPAQASVKADRRLGSATTLNSVHASLQILQVIATHIPHPCSHPCSLLKPDSNTAVLAASRDFRDLEIVCYIGQAI